MHFESIITSDTVNAVRYLQNELYQTFQHSNNEEAIEVRMFFILKSISVFYIWKRQMISAIALLLLIPLLNSVFLIRRLLDRSAKFRLENSFIYIWKK